MKNKMKLYAILAVPKDKYYKKFLVIDPSFGVIVFDNAKDAFSGMNQIYKDTSQVTPMVIEFDFAITPQEPTPND